MTSETGTREKILHFGMHEFVRHGFINASLRNIASAAGMTTGAIYTYFKDKNALFGAIVDPVCRRVEEMFGELSAAYYDNNGIMCETTMQNSIARLHNVYAFIYEYFDIFRLLVVGAEGSSKADFVHKIVDYEVTHTLAYLDKMKKDSSISSKLNNTVIHTVSESFINAILEPVRHNMSYEQAIENLEFLCVFYAGGWMRVFKEMLN